MIKTCLYFICSSDPELFVDAFSGFFLLSMQINGYSSIFILKQKSILRKSKQAAYLVEQKKIRIGEKDS